MVRCGLVVRIPGFHPGGPGSIPGTGKFVLCLSFLPSVISRMSMWYFSVLGVGVSRTRYTGCEVWSTCTDPKGPHNVFYVIIVFHRGLSGPSSKSNWVQLMLEGSVPDYLRNPIATCDFPECPDPCPHPPWIRAWCKWLLFEGIFLYVISLTLKAPRKKCIWKCRLPKSSTANNCLTLRRIKYRSKTAWTQTRLLL